MSKCGTTQDHCCWFKGTVCQYLEQKQHNEFMWRCQLRAAATSWDEVHASTEYVANVKPKLVDIGLADVNCGDWPYVGHKCNDCGEVG